VSDSAERMRRWRAANPERSRENDRRWRAANPERARTHTRRWATAHPEGARERAARWRAVQRRWTTVAVLTYYSQTEPPSCDCPGGCGATEDLTLDHVNGGGGKHRKQIGGSGVLFYRWLVRNGFPDDPPLQVLCGKCNSSKGATGTECVLWHE
jgi:hypothetical protein